MVTMGNDSRGAVVVDIRWPRVTRQIVRAAHPAAAIPRNTVQGSDMTSTETPVELTTAPAEAPAPDSR